MSNQKKIKGSVSIESGFAFGSSDFREFGFPIIRMSDLRNGTVDTRHAARVSPAVVMGLDQFKLKSGDLLLGMSGSLDGYGVVPKDAEVCYLNQRVGRLVVHDEKKSNYSYFAKLLTSAPYIKHAYKEALGIAQLNISSKQIEEFEAFIPDINEQEIIAKILDTLDTAIQRTEAIIEKLKQVKQGLLHDLLTRGIDANGELRPPVEVAPQRYKKSPLGMIPKEWNAIRLKSLMAEPTRNGLYKPSIFHGSGPLMVQMGGLFCGDSVDYQSATRVMVSPSELNIFKLVEGDLLFARRSLVFEGAGLCVLVRHVPEYSTFESSIIRCRLNNAVVIPEYAVLFLRSPAAYIDRRTYIRQVAVSGVSSSDIASFLIAVPDVEEQNLIVKKERSVEKAIVKEVEYLKKIKKEKSGLMDDLLTGRVRVTKLLPAATSA